MTALTPQTIVADPAIFTMRSIGDDLALYLSDAEILVSSKSEPNGFRVVNILNNSCSCPAGAHGLDHCHHRTTAKIAAELDRREATPVLPEPMDPGYRCWRCGCQLPNAKSTAETCDRCTRERLIAERGVCGICNKRPRGMVNGRVLASCCMCLTAARD